MAKTYNDAEMLLGTQIAYMDIPEGYTVGEYVDLVLSAPPDANQAEAQKRYDTVSNFLDMAKENNITDWQSWRVVDRVDDQPSGMYGCVIETDSNNAMIGFRGSESYDSEQVLKDWITADVGMLNNPLTLQQKRATDYMEHIWDKYGDQYDTFSVTGHSLGGNLAEHATYTAPKGMKDKINHTINYDGPGFSDEYLAYHANDIANTNVPMSSYQWSWVGSIFGLSRSPKVNIVQVDVKDSGKDKLLYKHDTKYLKIEDGHVVPGKKGLFEHFVSGLTETIDAKYFNFGALLITYPVAEYLYNTELFKKINNFIYDGAVKTIEFIDSAKKTLNDLKKTIKDIYISWATVDDFYVNTSSLKSLSTTLQNLGTKIDSITSEAESIQRRMKYDSVSGSYYKNQVYWLCNSMEGDAKTAKNAADAIGDVITMYMSSDSAVAKLYK